MFIDGRTEGISEAPKERNIPVAAHILTNISLLWSWGHMFGLIVYKHSIPNGIRVAY